MAATATHAGRAHHDHGLNVRADRRRVLPDGDVRFWFAQGGHYSALGNQVVAQWLGRQLATSGVAAATVPSGQPHVAQTQH